MAYTFKLPDIGEGVAEAEIVKWLVAVGDTVVEDQPLVEVLTDKASVEIPSPRAGKVSQLGGAEGATIPVGAMLIEIEVASGGASAPAPSKVAAASAGAATATTSSPAAAPPARVEAVPAARQAAKEHGIDLATIAGSGPNGRITLEDVERVLEGGAEAAGPSAPGGSALEERIPLRGMRKKIAEHMALAASTVPQFTFVAEADMTAVVAHRKAARARAEAEGIKLTYVAYIVAALVPALAKYPLLNASLDHKTQEIVLKKHYDIGIATATDEGLTVPVLHGADRLGLFAIAREIERLAAAAREKKLALNELTGGTFTVTTTGAKGGLLATPIVHLPQVAILGVHAITPRAVVRDGQVVAREMTNLSLSLDHRVVDGQVGADFLYEVIANLEDPARVLREAK
ncbi:MAG: dihydrolipoamide acetyltransferase family protein [Candidatus Eisenbacteria bacterium]